MTDPTPDEINAALAEYMGWIPYRSLDKREAWQPQAAARDAVFRNPTECLNACALVAGKAGVSVEFDEGGSASAADRYGKSAGADADTVQHAVALALYRLIQAEGGR